MKTLANIFGLAKKPVEQQPVEHPNFWMYY